MTPYLLDTNVFSELRKVGDGKADARVVAWFSRIDIVETYLSSITIMELEIGIRRLEHRDSKAKRLREWFDARVFPAYAERILPIDRGVALRCAELHVPGIRPERDAFVAATALVHGMTLVTRNVGDFRSVDVALRNPWDAV